jgi:hypothetical protein
MKLTEFFYWWLPPDAWSKKPRLSKWKMTRDEAEKRHPGATPDLSSREVRECPETPQELGRANAEAPYSRKG